MMFYMLKLNNLIMLAVNYLYKCSFIAKIFLLIKQGFGGEGQVFCFLWNSILSDD